LDCGQNFILSRRKLGQKDVEFSKFLNLPQLVKKVPFSAIVNQTGGTAQSFSKDEVEDKGWRILNNESSAGNSIQYQQFIGDSLGEFSVAKETYVKSASGWFSCRSACYLASGRPVVTQDTGWSNTFHAVTGCLHSQT
jgi:hypothetical protein